jgi:aspartyl-tRNA(Asn)/glutamyl-tRNA(Gln) amidotransferase subunit C
MSIDQATVARIATLARIRLSDAQRDATAVELSRILDWVALLDEVDTRDVEPMRSVMPITPTLRDDVVSDGGRPEDVLRNAPQRSGDYFVVPKVVE